MINESQTIFTLFYALYFAVTTTLSGKFQPFDTPSMYAWKRLAWIRFISSFVLLNIGPLLYFVCIFRWLKDRPFSADFWSMLMFLILGLAGFGFYRIFFGLMLISRSGRYLFYGPQLPKPVEQELEQRDPSHRNWLAHFVPGVLWVGITLALGYLWIY